jgi:hypothetical protein
MKKLSTLYFFLFPLCLVLLLVRCHKDKADISNQITILVKEKDTNLPISNANVRFCQSTNPGSVNCQDLGKTDDNGQLIYNLKTFLVPGNSKFYISKDGFKNDSILVSDLAQKTFSLNLEKLANYNTEFTVLVKEKKTNLPIPNATVIFWQYTSPEYSNYQLFGYTDTNGKVTSNLNTYLVPGNSKFIVFGEKFYIGTISVSDTIQKTFSLGLSKFPNLEFHLKYDSDSIPKKFLFYRRYITPPAYDVPGGYNDERLGFFYTSKVNGVFHADTTIYLSITDIYTQSFQCTMCDPSYIFPSQNLVWSPFPNKVLTIPGLVGDTTFIFNAFW